MCLVDGDLTAVHADPRATRVRLTVCRGKVAFDAEASSGPTP